MYKKESGVLLQNYRERKTIDLLERFADGYEILLNGMTATGLELLKDFCSQASGLAPADSPQAVENLNAMIGNDDIEKWFPYPQGTPEHALLNQAVSIAANIMTEEKKNQVNAFETPHTLQAILTDKTLMYALDPFTPGQASRGKDGGMISPAIFLMPAGKTNIIKDVINKELTDIVDDFGGLTMEQAAKDAAGTLDLSLLRQLFTVALENKTDFLRGNGNIVVTATRLYADLGRAKWAGEQSNRRNILNDIDKICRCLAIWPDGRAEEVLHMMAFEKGVLTLHSEYFLSILKREKTLLYSRLLASSTGKERNKAGLETAKLIGQNLTQRGEYNKAADGRIYYKASFNSIIERVPLLKCELENMTDTSNKNRKLKSTFKRAYALLQDVEKMPDMARFENLKIREVYPTTTTLDAVLEISYTKDLKTKGRKQQKRKKTNTPPAEID